MSQKESCWNKEKLQLSILTSFKELLLHLDQTIQRLMSFYLPSSTKHVIHVSCPYCSHFDAPHVPYIKEELYLSCCKGLKDLPKMRYIPCGVDIASISGKKNECTCCIVH